MEVKVRHSKDHDPLAELTAGDFNGFLSTSLSSDPISAWRKASFERARQLPSPTNKDEDFKYVNFRRLDLSDLKPIEVISETNANGYPASEIRAGVMKIDDIPERLRVAVKDSRQPAKFFFGSLNDAAMSIPEVVGHYLAFCDSQFAARKLALLSHAYLSNGSFLYLPKDTELAAPRHLYTRLSGEKTLTSYAMIVALEEHASAELIWDIAVDEDASGFLNGTLDVVAGPGSKMRLLVNTELNQHIDGTVTLRVHLAENAELELVTLNADGRVVQMEVDVRTAGPGSRALVNGVYIGRGRESFNFLTHQDHQVGDSTTDLYYAGTLAGKANANYLGKITIAENAQRSDAYQTNRNLVLNRGVKVNSSPKLEISANDVRCSHGATTARVSDEELFYLRSRGISHDRARVLLADGFLEQVRARIADATLKAAFTSRLNWYLSSWRSDDSER